MSSAATRPSSAPRITSSYSAIRSQLQKSSKKVALGAVALGERARARRGCGRSRRRSVSTCAASSRPRIGTAPSRRKASAMLGSHQRSYQRLRPRSSTASSSAAARRERASSHGRRARARASGPGPAPGRQPRAPPPSRRAGARGRLERRAQLDAARAAAVSSTARIRRRLSTATRSLRAAPQPIDTWSSCIALVGSESTAAGAASRRFSATIAAWVYWAIISPESTPGSAARNGGSPCERLASSSRSVRRSLIEPTSAAAIARKSQASATGAPWKLPHDSTRPSGSTIGLSIAERARPRRPSARGRRCRGRRRGPAACSESSRRPAPAGRPRGGWRRSPSRRAAGAGSPALAAWPGCGRSAIRSAAKARSVPSSASVLIAAATSASAQQAIDVGEGEHEHPEDPVGAVDERQALLRAEHRRLDPRGRQRLGRPRRRSPAASNTSPSPISASAQCASGARSPLAPSEPCSGTTGSSPAASIASIVSASTGRAPGAAHRQRAGAQEHHRPHHLALDRRAHAGGVRAHQRPLQLGPAVGRDPRLRERAEAGRDPVGGLVGGGEPRDDRRRLVHRRAGLVARAGARAPSRATATTCSAVAPCGPSSIVVRRPRPPPNLLAQNSGPKPSPWPTTRDGAVVRGAQLAALRRLRGQHDVVAEMDPGRHVGHPAHRHAVADRLEVQQGDDPVLGRGRQAGRRRPGWRPGCPR